MKNLVRYRAGPLSRRPTIRPIQYFARGNTYIEPEWERSDITYVNTSNIHVFNNSFYYIQLYLLYSIIHELNGR